MPTTQVWNGGAGDGTATTAGNYVSGVAPIAGDSVSLTIAPTSALTNGTFPALVDFTVTDAYGNFPIGGAGATVTFGNVTGTMSFGSRSPIINVTTTGTVASAVFNCPNNNQNYIAGGTWTLVTTGTNVTLNVIASAIVVTGQDAGGARWIVATNGTAITTWTGCGPITLTTRNITTCNADPGATVTLTGTAIIATAGNIVGATLVHQSSGTLSGIILRSRAVLTPIGNPNATAAAGTVKAFSGTTIVPVVSGCVLSYTLSPVGPSIGVGGTQT